MDPAAGPARGYRTLVGGGGVVRNVIGVVAIAVGVVWLLDNLGVVNVDLWSHVARLWPLVLVYFGLAGLRQALQPPASFLVAGINAVVAVIGALLLAGNYGLVQVDLGDVLAVVAPVLLVLAGLQLLQWPRPSSRGPTQFAIMGGVNFHPDASHPLADRTFFALMGGGDVDLSRARFPAEPVNLTFVSIMGGWRVRVPQGVRVEFSGDTLLGGMEVFGESAGGITAHKTVGTDEEGGPLLRIYAQGVMGGVEIKRA